MNAFASGEGAKKYRRRAIKPYLFDLTDRSIALILSRAPARSAVWKGAFMATGSPLACVVGNRVQPRHCEGEYRDEVRKWGGVNASTRSFSVASRAARSAWW